MALKLVQLTEDDGQLLREASYAAQGDIVQDELDAWQEKMGRKQELESINTMRNNRTGE